MGRREPRVWPDGEPVTKEQERLLASMADAVARAQENLARKEQAR